MVLFTTFVNGRLCKNGRLIEEPLVISQETGKILKRAGYIGGDIIDLEDNIIAPGFLELQTNGMLGFHFTHYNDDQTYANNINKASKYLLRTGVTSFWATIPTVEEDVYHKILPCLAPTDRVDAASLLGAHVEGPYLHPSKKGAHNDKLFQTATNQSAENLYGQSNLEGNVKLVTVAPEIPGAEGLIKHLTSRYSCRVSLGHSSASYEQGLAGCQAGATCLTHLFNAMNPLHHREPGLAGLTSGPFESSPYYSLIADNIHLHPATLSMAFRINPERAILITDSIELAGLGDGTYPGHAQIPHRQRKTGDKVVIEGTDTLIGSCCSLNQCVRNLVDASGCSIAEAVRCVTENIADMMGVADRGKLEEGRRADFVVLNDQAEVMETWIAGKKVWEKQ